MKPFWPRAVAPQLLLLVWLAAPASAEPCLDGLGLLHPDGATFYDFPHGIRRCRVYKCLEGQKTVIRDRCKQKSEWRLVGKAYISDGGFRGERP